MNYFVKKLGNVAIAQNVITSTEIVLVSEDTVVNRRANTDTHTFSTFSIQDW